MSGYEIRPSVEADAGAVLQLMARALGWEPGGADAELFRWKHRQSPFGVSPAWVAVEDGQVIGFRTFMRWEFEDRGEVVRAVRAVDTATDPDHQGRGIFKALTLHAITELRADGVACVFNTPNDQSRPGYLKMGWQVVGRLPVSFRPRTPASMIRVLRARVPAELRSTPSQAGQAASTVLAQEGVAALLDAAGGSAGLRTRRSVDFLRWRYSQPDLHYRAVAAGPSMQDGLLLLRTRRRGAALELALCDLLLPAGASGRGLVGRALRLTGADYAIAVGRGRGLAPLPRQGPVLTCLPLDGGTLPDWQRADLVLGDVELF